MPEPNGASYKIAGDIAELTMGQLIQEGRALTVQCAGCYRHTEWTPSNLSARFAKHGHVRLSAVAERLRCDRCRGRYVRVWRAETPVDRSSAEPM